MKNTTTTDKPYPRGELCIKSDFVVPGYFKRPEATAALFDEDGFLLTGDIMEERGPSIPIDTLVKVIQESGIHANPDMGNWKDEESMERGLRLMYPLALTVSHVKWIPDRFSFATAVGISKEMGFKGTY